MLALLFALSVSASAQNFVAGPVQDVRNRAGFPLQVVSTDTRITQTVGLMDSQLRAAPVIVKATETLPVVIDGGQSDAFGRVRISAPVQMFESQLTSGPGDLIWITSTSASGAALWLSTQSAVELSVPGTSGAFAIRQTYEYIRYQPGKSQQILLTAVVGSSSTNIVKDWGYGDRYNGIFFRQDSTGLNVVIRSTTTGVFSERVVSQANFNMDKMDGNGPSRFKFDPTMGNIYWIDFQWLGVGEVRMGVVTNNSYVTAHIFRNSNALPGVYMNNPNLPMHYSVWSKGASAGGRMRQICTSVSMEGGTDPAGIVFSSSNAVNLISVTTRRPILSIRKKTSYRGQENRGRVQLLHLGAYSDNNKSAHCDLIQGGVLTGASFVSEDAHSQVEVDTAATSISGGLVIDSLDVPASGAGPVEAEVKNKVVLTTGFNGDSPSNLSIVCTAYTTVATISSHLVWEEFR